MAHYIYSFLAHVLLEQMNATRPPIQAHRLPIKLLNNRRQNLQYDFDSQAVFAAEITQASPIEVHFDLDDSVIRLGEAGVPAAYTTCRHRQAYSHAAGAATITRAYTSECAAYL